MKKFILQEKSCKVRVIKNLYLEVKPNGKKYWILHYTDEQGKVVSKTLGRYPLVSIIDAKKQAALYSLKVSLCNHKSKQKLFNGGDIMKKLTFSSLTLREKLYRVKVKENLYLEVRPNGRKYLVQRFTDKQGKSVTKTLGLYPNISFDGEVTL